jgi:hypothetical protein
MRSHLNAMYLQWSVLKLAVRWLISSRISVAILRTSPTTSTYLSSDRPENRQRSRWFAHNGKGRSLANPIIADVGSTI